MTFPDVLLSQNILYTLIRFCLISSLDDRDSVLSPEIKGIFYNDQDNSYNLLRYLSNDSKEVLLLKENTDAKEFLDTISKLTLMRKDYTYYQDIHSACIDSYMINNGIIFLFHDTTNNKSYIVNRALVPNPESNYENFLLFTKLYRLKDTENFKPDYNFLEVNRKELIVKGANTSSDLDLSQVVIPIVHIYKEQQ